MLCHRFQAALFLQPLEDQAAYIDIPARRRVVQAACIRMGLVSQHRRNLFGKFIRNQILAHDDNRHTGRTDILLNTAVKQAVLCDIDRTAQEVTGNIRHKNVTLGVRQCLVFRTVNRVVFTDVDIIRIFRNRKIRAVRQIREGLVCRRCDHNRLSVFGRFRAGFLCPLTGYDEGRLMILHQIHGNHCELCRCASLQEHHGIIIGNSHQITQILFCFLDNRIVDFSAVGHLHNGHSAALVVQHVGCALFQHGFRKYCRTG